MKINEFLNPKSMVTPSIAGGLIMVIANTLWITFTIPQKWSALILSFLLIIPILAKYSALFYEKVIYFIINGLTIFALAINTNFAGKTISEFKDEINEKSAPQPASLSLYPMAPISSPVPAAPAARPEQPFFQSWF